MEQIAMHMMYTRTQTDRVLLKVISGNHYSVLSRDISPSWYTLISRRRWVIAGFTAPALGFFSK